MSVLLSFVKTKARAETERRAEFVGLKYAVAQSPETLCGLSRESLVGRLLQVLQTQRYLGE